MSWASEEAQPTVTETSGRSVLMSQCQAPSAPGPARRGQVAHNVCSWRRAAKTGALHEGSDPSSVAWANMVFHAHGHVGGPQRGPASHTSTHHHGAREARHNRVPSKVGPRSALPQTARVGTPGPSAPSLLGPWPASADACHGWLRGCPQAPQRSEVLGPSPWLFNLLWQARSPWAERAWPRGTYTR